MVRFKRCAYFYEGNMCDLCFEISNWSCDYSMKTNLFTGISINVHSQNADRSRFSLPCEQPQFLTDGVQVQNVTIWAIPATFQHANFRGIKTSFVGITRNQICSNCMVGKNTNHYIMCCMCLNSTDF